MPQRRIEYTLDCFLPPPTILRLTTYPVFVSVSCSNFKPQSSISHLFSTSMEFLRLNILAPLLLSLSLFLPLTLAVDVTYCDKNADYDVTVQGVEISPYPVERGAPATFSISANTGETITGGKLVIDVSYFGWHIHSETHDLCEESSCPVSSGDFVISHTQVLPGFTPPGTYNLKMKLVDKKNQELTCIGFDFSIGFASPVADS